MRGNLTASGRGLLWLRIVLLVAGLSAGLWLSFAPASGLYQVRPRDRASFRRIQAEVASAGTATTQPATAQLWTMTGDQGWQDLATQISDTVTGTTKTLLANLDTGLGENDFYFPADRAPLSTIPTPPRPGTWPLYVQVAPADQTSYLEVSYLPRGVGLRNVPAELAYPLRQYALWCFIVGIAGFVLLPHSYYRWPSIRTAEYLVGVVVAGGFAAIWFMPADLARPLERRPEISPEAVIRQEQVAKELTALEQEMNRALADLDKGSLAERKTKLDAYKAMVARRAKLSQEFVDPDLAAPATTQPTSNPTL